MGSRTGCKGTHPFQDSVRQGLNQEAGLDEGCIDATSCWGKESGGGGEEEAEERIWNQLRAGEKSSSNSEQQQQSDDEKRLWSIQLGWWWGDFWVSSTRSKEVSDSPAWQEEKQFKAKGGEQQGDGQPLQHEEQQ